MSNERRERYQATLIGGALGDTLGMPVEGWKKAQIERYYGKITQPISPKPTHPDLFNPDGSLKEEDDLGKLKFYAKDLEKGDFTDDTILTLALAESIVIRRGFDLDDIAARQLFEYTVRLGLDGTASGGFGGTTREAFERLLTGKFLPTESGVIGGPGNGPSMKMAPLGLLLDATKDSQIRRGAEAVGRITHLDPRSVVSGVLQTDAIFYLLQDVSRDDFLFNLRNSAQIHEEPLDERFTWYKMGGMTPRMDWIYKNRDATDEEAFNYIGASSVVYRSYPFAVFMFQKYWGEPLQGLIETVNFGGDCDTTGAMYGAMAGAKNGQFYPQEWVEILDQKDRIVKAADGIFNLR